MGIHGDKSQQERDWVLNGKFKQLGQFLISIWKQYYILTILYLLICLAEFKYGKAPILIATDVASRGLGQYSPFVPPQVYTFDSDKRKCYVLSLTLVLFFLSFSPSLKERSVWQGLGMTSPGSPEGEGGFLEVSWLARHGPPSCADIQRWPGPSAGLSKSEKQKVGQKWSAGLSSSPTNSSVLWPWFGLLHTPTRLTVSALSQPPSLFYCYMQFFIFIFLGGSPALKSIWFWSSFLPHFLWGRWYFLLFSLPWLWKHGWRFNMAVP